MKTRVRKLGILLLLVRKDVLRDDALLKQYPNARQIPAEILDGRGILSPGIPASWFVPIRKRGPS